MLRLLTVVRGDAHVATCGLLVGSQGGGVRGGRVASCRRSLPRRVGDDEQQTKFGFIMLLLAFAYPLATKMSEMMLL